MTKQLNLTALVGALAVGAALASPVTAFAGESAQDGYFKKSLLITDGFTDRDWEQLQSARQEGSVRHPRSADELARHELFEMQLRITDGFTARDWKQLQSISSSHEKPARSAAAIARHEYLQRQLRLTDGFTARDLDDLGS